MDIGLLAKSNHSLIPYSIASSWSYRSSHFIPGDAVILLSIGSKRRFAEARPTGEERKEMERGRNAE